MVKKSLLYYLVSNHDLHNLEQHLVFKYLITKELNYSRSPILLKYFQGFKKSEKLISEISALEINNLKDLENHLELLIPEVDRKLNGAFFTPDYIIDFIINQVKPLENDKNLDPSCGCGAFLIGLIDYYKRTFTKSIKAVIQENIYGSDILSYNIDRTKLLLTLYALQHNEILDTKDFNLYTQDSLKAKWNLKFDTIVGNPPYVKFQDLTKETREYLVKNWKTIEGGTYNLYFAFFELGYNLLNGNGRLGYITPNNYFTSLAGESIRRFFQEKKCLTRVIDFTHNKVFDAQTYTAITFLNKKENDAIKFDRIKNNITPKDFLSTANGSLNYLKDLNPKKWRLLKNEEQKNISIIESVGTPIGKLFDISVGIATLKDKVFFIDGSKTKNGCFIKVTSKGEFEIEKGVTKPVYKISDFKTQVDAKLNTRRIICPYKIRGNTATPIPEVEFKKRYPKCYAYLLSEKKELQKRDKGKVNFSPFYIWGRTQGLAKKGKRILTPTFSHAPRFLVVNEEDSYFTNGYGIFYKKDQKKSLFSYGLNPILKIENIEVLQKILNSIVMHYYVSNTSVSIEGGYPCYQKNFIEKFTIPDFTDEEIESLRLIERQNEIDNFLIAKYQVNILSPNLCS